MLVCCLKQGCLPLQIQVHRIVKLAHEKGIQSGSFSRAFLILMAMMSSGMNGQNFAFNGYLPIDKGERKKAIKELEKLSVDKNQSQIFIETPYRNQKMFADLKAVLSPSTRLCIAADITLLQNTSKHYAYKIGNNSRQIYIRSQRFLSFTNKRTTKEHFDNAK